MAADPERGAPAPRSISFSEPRWEAHAQAVPGNVSPMRRALVAFAAEHGADLRTQADVALASSETITNAVVHAFVGLPPGSVWVVAVVADGILHVTVTDDGTGMRPRPDSPGLGLGLPTIAHLATAVNIAPGPRGRGTEVCLEFTLPREHQSPGGPGGVRT